MENAPCGGMCRQRSCRCYCVKSPTLHRCPQGISTSLRDAPAPTPAGANWEAVSQYCDLSDSLKAFDPPQSVSKPSSGSQEGGSSTAGDGRAPGGSEAEGEQGGGDGSGYGGSRAGSGYAAASDAGAVCAELAQGVPFLGAEPPAPEPAAQKPAGHAYRQEAAVQAHPAQQPGPIDLEHGGHSAGRAKGQPEAAGAYRAPDAYYSTVPAGAGAALQRQLQSALLASRQRADQAQKDGNIRAQGSTDLPSSPREGEGSATNTLSAASARQLQQRLARELAALRQRQAQQGQQAGSGPPSPKGQQASTSGPSLPERHAFTLSGAAGKPAEGSSCSYVGSQPILPALSMARTMVSVLRKRLASLWPAGASLAAELRRQLAGPQRSAAGRPPLAPARPLQKDLLGRRLPAAGSSASSPRWAFAPARPGLLRSASNLSVDGAASAGAGSPPSLSPAASFLLPAVAPAAPPLAAQMELRRVQTFNAGPASADGSHAGQEILKAAWHVQTLAGGSAATDAATHGPEAEQEAGGQAGALPPTPPLEMTDLRLGLLVRLHRTCHARRMQGLLSAQVSSSSA